MKQKRVVKPGISVCSRITSLMNNHTKSRKRATIPKKGRESDDKNGAAIVKTVPQLGLCLARLGVIGFSKRGRQSRGNPMQKVFGPIRRVRFTQSTQRQAIIWENRGPSLGKIHVKAPHERSPYALKFENRSQEKTARQQRCARSKVWNLADNIYKLKEKDKTTFYSPSEEWVLPVTSILEPEERKRESLW